MIGAVNQRWLDRRAAHLRLLEWQQKTEAALLARRRGRKSRSERSAKGWPKRIHEAHQRDALINHQVAN